MINTARRLLIGSPFIIMKFQSPYRLTILPLLDYVEELKKRKNPQDYITVVIPEFETRKWWHRLLHNQTGWLLHAMLVIKENVSVTTIPYHLNK